MSEVRSAWASGTLRIGDLDVVRLGLGVMWVTGPGIWGEPKDRASARRLLQRAYDLGICFFDTADAYGPYVAEELIAEALHPYPKDLVIATKGGQLRDGPGIWRPDGRPEHLRSACEGSLRRLRVDRIDLYQLHRPDPAVPIEESVGALVDLQREGKVRFIGLSNVTLEQLEAAQAVAPVVSVQNRYNLFDRASEDVLRHCERDGLAFLPWAPLARDALSPGLVLSQIARAHGAAERQVALAWLLEHSRRMVPIPGTSSIAHLEENVQASHLQLEIEEYHALDLLAPPPQVQARAAVDTEEARPAGP